MWMVFRQSGLLAMTGVAVGVVAAFGLLRLGASLLYGVGPYDPTTLAGGMLLLTIVTLAASYAPARRAMRLDPTLALRHD
jgi:putative ABC transport system permease protein